MSYVKINTEDWATALHEELQSFFDPEEFDPEKLKEITPNPHAQILAAYIEWAKGYYDGKEVPLVPAMASLYYQSSEAIVRHEEDRFLIEELKQRTAPMTDTEWEEYCKSKNAIVVDGDYALLTDGCYDTV